ncbi:MAG TPA: phytanoyl-CoA dioxygenase family protein [Nitriliruptorales bacterium]
MTISPHHVDEVRNQGFAVVPEFVPRAQTSRLREAAAAHFPPAEEVRRDQAAVKGLANGQIFRLFPFDSDDLNDLALRPDVIGFAQAACGGRPVHLAQAVMRASYGGAGVPDQHLHRDYTDNTMLVPSDDPAFTHIPFLIYLTDVSLETSPTHVCPRTATDDRPLWPRERPRDLDPELYEHERPVVAEAGTAIVYSMSTFHRGSAFKAPTGVRFVLHVVYRPAGCEWMASTPFGGAFATEAGRRLMSRLDPSQRAVLGVPLPGHPFWTSETLAGMGERYPGIDLGPYLSVAVAHDGGRQVDAATG